MEQNGDKLTNVFELGMELYTCCLRKLVRGFNKVNKHRNVEGIRTEYRLCLVSNASVFRIGCFGHDHKPLRQAYELVKVAHVSYAKVRIHEASVSH